MIGRLRISGQAQRARIGSRTFAVIAPASLEN